LFYSSQSAGSSVVRQSNQKKPQQHKNRATHTHNKELGLSGQSSCLAYQPWSHQLPTPLKQFFMAPILVGAVEVGHYKMQCYLHCVETTYVFDDFNKQ
jgi:hypothetical protein